MAQETSAPRTAAADPHPRTRESDSTADPPPLGMPTGGVTLDRLLTVVVLSPAQATLVAARLLDAIQLQDATNGTRPGDHCLWWVALTPTGEVEVDRARAGGGASIAGLLAQLSHNARRLPVHPSPEQLELLRRLEETTAEPRLQPGAGARALEGALVEVLGSEAGQRLTRQLGALVATFAHIAPSVAVPVDAPTGRAGSQPDPHRAAPTRFTPVRPQRRRPTRGRRRVPARRMAMIALFLVVALTASGYVMLGSPDGVGAGLLGRDSPAPASPTTTAPAGSSQEPARQPRSRPRPLVETLAGREAGPLTGVEVQKAAGCTPGALCPVTVTVRFRPASTTRPVTWRLGTARLCANGITWSPPITVTAEPGWTSVYANTSVAVPEGRSLALVALTTAPARAQSSPVPVTGSSLRC